MICTINAMYSYRKKHSTANARLQNIVYCSSHFNLAKTEFKNVGKHNLDYRQTLVEKEGES